MPAPVAADHRGVDERSVARLTAAALLGFAAAWMGVRWLASLGAYGVPDSALEVNLYHQYAANLAHGQLAYRDFAFEYPPLALPVIAAPWFLVADPSAPASYRDGFHLVMAAIGLVMVAAVVRGAAALRLPRRDLVVIATATAASPLLLGALTVSRYDLLPAMLTAVAFAALATGRTNASAFFLGLGVLAKVYPLVLAPFVATYLWRSGGRGAAVRWSAILAVTVAGGVLPFLVVAPDGILDALARAPERPLQVETLGASVMYLVEAMGGPGFRVIHTFDSYNIAGPTAATMATLQSGLVLLVIGAAWVAFVRGAPTLGRLALAGGAAVTAFVAFGKVLSPQYVIWLVPVLGVAPQRPRFLPLAGLVAILLLTGSYYPARYLEYFRDRDLALIAIVAARNALLVAVAGAMLLRLLDGCDEGAAAAPEMASA